MRIADIQASVHEFPVTIPLIEKPVESWKVVFCQVETDEGIVGWGMTGHVQPHAVVAAIEHYVFPAVRGLDPRDTERVHGAVWWSENSRTSTGAITSALSAVDIALWDIQGKIANRTVAELLGGHRDYAPTYVTFGFPRYDQDQLVECARNLVREGHRRLKIVVAVDKGGWAEDARRVRAVRDAVGPDVDLMIDANMMFNPLDARLLCREIEDCRLTWFEEPLYQNDARALADLRRLGGVPIAAGQMEGNRWRMRDLVEGHAVDVLQPNVCYIGGFTEGRKVAHLAQAYNLPIANGGGWPILNMHLMAGLMNGWLVEFHLGMWQVGERIFRNSPSPDPATNTVRIPALPGLGFTPDFDSLKEHRKSI
ncbi:MAG: mandelate racemase/muconate lactonizing enzyme family protein [Betaproteobacteria bacterium]